MTRSTTANDYKFDQVRLDSVRYTPAFLELTKQHDEEIKPYRRHKLNIAWGSFQEMEDSGRLLLVTVSTNNELVGYLVMNIYTNIQYGLIAAKQQAIYLKPSHRGGVGSALIAAADKALKGYGVEAVIDSVPTGQSWSKALTKQGYEQTEINYMKELL